MLAISLRKALKTAQIEVAAMKLRRGREATIMQGRAISNIELQRRENCEQGEIPAADRFRFWTLSAKSAPDISGGGGEMPGRGIEDWMRPDYFDEEWALGAGRAKGHCIVRARGYLYVVSLSRCNIDARSSITSFTDPSFRNWYCWRVICLDIYNRRRQVTRNMSNLGRK